MGNKRFKDPIYGYIEVEENLISNVIDTAAFQRLRDVIQTSYSPLYSSAVHNRFVHSIGVYYLGMMAAETFLESLGDNPPQFFNEISNYIETFKLACLLHDVGHAPFSHTGEQFYLQQENYTELHEQLLALVTDENLGREIIDNGYKAAQHELMSVIIALHTFPEMISDEKKSFFARCITGYKYVNSMDEKKSCLNCLIELLNSKIIDVDKMDYLIRDAYITGFDTVSIDYIRLLSSIRIVRSTDRLYRICYDKSAISVIENVVYAHDAERKWIQNHPSVLYEAYLIQNIIDEIMATQLKTPKLTYEFLTETGKEVEGVGLIRLMGDSDIKFLMKNLKGCNAAGEYYSRRFRKHPLWKTEAEFQAIFEGEDKNLPIIGAEFDELKKYLGTLGLPFVINKTALEACKNDIEETEKLLVGQENTALQNMQEALEGKREHYQWLKILEDFSAQEELDFDFLIIRANQFNSGFRKPEFGSIEIMFSELRNPCRFSAVSNVLTASKSKSDKFFFIYYSRGKRTPNIKSLIKELVKMANNKVYNERLV